MLRRQFTLPLIALGSLLLPGFGTRAEADLGLESDRPLSDPHQAEIDERAVGTWRAIIQEKTYYLHVGIGNVVGQSNWMELVLVNPGEKPTFYLHHKIGFPTTVIWAEWQNANPGQHPNLAGAAAIMDPWPETETDTRDITSLGYSYA